MLFAFGLCFGIGAFSFWLLFPGYPTVDIASSFNFVKNDFAPVFLSYLLEWLFSVFGKHSYYMFLSNLIPFYTGLFLLIAGFYIRFRNPFALMLCFPTFIANFYFLNIYWHYSFGVSALMFCLWCCVLCIVLIHPFNATRLQKFASFCLYLLCALLICLTLLWRFNAIVGVFPVFLVIGFLWCKDAIAINAPFLKQKGFYQYAMFCFFGAFVCLFIAKAVPKLLVVGDEAHPANHIFLHQIAGACVPANDALCFKDEWYREGKNFENVKATYLRDPLDADKTLDRELGSFKIGTLEGLSTMWLKSICKHPLNYLAYQARFIYHMWKKNAGFILDSKEIQTLNDRYAGWTKLLFKESEQKPTFSPLQQRIYEFFYDFRLEVNHFLGVGFNVFLLFLSWAKLRDFRRIPQRNNLSQHSNATQASKRTLKDGDKILDTNEAIKTQLEYASQSSTLVLCFSVALAGFSSALIYALFTPVVSERYMSPAFSISVVAFCAFVAYKLIEKRT